jgi:hypothetical protein
MSSSSSVRDAWQTKIWDNSTVLAMTSKIFLYDVTVDSSFNVAELYYAEPSEMPKVNFFLCLTNRRQQPQIMGNILIDRMEAVDDLVRTSLTGTWNSTVDYYDGGTPQAISVVTIDDKKCWRGEIIYIGTKTN